MYMIAIDCGASFIKACRMDEKTGQIEDLIVQETPHADPEETMLEKSVRLIRALIYKLAGTEKRVKVGFSTEMHGFVAADCEGVPFMDYVSWQDESGYENFDAGGGHLFRPYTVGT